ncbi:hypothetical protein [Actinacidiphila guanduensis]|uniref:Uncharacterized protein n=1 Tax=Actinacidiphila guanduensis TaxID=310781 RepID=A0A1G9YG58_9ACTN|nr:hypothetical protein [Actinacidiphila guanduensis]SDN08169.1 hypothetical protein SAMN05216259_102552 [Actinacidiphila guanduensis]
MEALTIVKTFGHITIAVTLDVYARVVNATLQAAAQRMDDALGLDDETEEEGGETAS